MTKKMTPIEAIVRAKQLLKANAEGSNDTLEGTLCSGYVEALKTLIGLAETVPTHISAVSPTNNAPRLRNEVNLYFTRKGAKGATKSIRLGDVGSFIMNQIEDHANVIISATSTDNGGRTE